MTSGPVVVFYLDDDNYEAEIDGLIGEVVRLSGADDPPFCYARSGLLLTLGDRVTATRYTPHTGGSRLWSGSTISVSPALEQQEKAELLDNLEFALRSPGFTLRSTLGVSYFCLSFSDIDVDLVREAIATLGISAKVAALAQFDMGNAICFGALWQTLSISHILTSGYVLESLQQAMIDFGFDEGGMHNADWSLRTRPWPMPGFFSDELGESSIYVERRLAELPLPPDPAYPRKRARPRRPSPVERALALAPTHIKKINSRDDPGLPGFFALEDPRWQWPDPEQSYQKMEHYCLKVGHSQGKWLGFQSIGYSAARPGDARFLAYALCSALIRGPFSPFDIKVSADGTLEFAINVVIPCIGGRFRNVCAAWNVKAGREVSLSSAYVTEPGKYPSTLIVQPPAKVADGRDWNDILGWAADFAAEYVSGVTPDTVQASGYLWLPHSDPTSSEFASWCRRSSVLSTAIFRRSAWGGRCTQLVSPFGFMGVSRTVASLRAMQYCLGVVGVRTLIEISDG